MNGFFVCNFQVIPWLGLKIAWDLVYTLRATSSLWFVSQLGTPPAYHFSKDRFLHLEKVAWDYTTKNGIDNFERQHGKDQINQILNQMEPMREDSIPLQTYRLKYFRFEAFVRFLNKHKNKYIVKRHLKLQIQWIGKVASVFLFQPYCHIDWIYTRIEHSS